MSVDILIDKDFEDNYGTDLTLHFHDKFKEFLQKIRFRQSELEFVAGKCEQKSLE